MTLGAVSASEPARDSAAWRAVSDVLRRLGRVSPWVPTALIALFCQLVWHWHGLSDLTFQNKDVAGIIYNARLLLDGDVPYIDSLEVKTPGAFLLFLPGLALDGVRGVWIQSVFWGAGTSLATGLLAAACWGWRYGPPAALLHAGGAGVAGFGDINYSFWLTLPFVGAVAFAAFGAKEPDPRRHRWLWLGAGASAMLAALVKPHAAPLLLLFVPMVARELVAREWRRAGAIALWGTAGAVLLFVLANLPFAALGHPLAFLEGLEASREFGGDYIGGVIEGSGGLGNAVWRGLHCTYGHLPYATHFAVLGAIPAFGYGAPYGERCVKWVPWVFLVVSLMSLSVTLRFYMHDDVQVLPALTVLAVRPGGVLGAFFEWLRRNLWVGLLVPVFFGAYNFAVAHKGIRMLQRYLQGHDAMVVELCDKYAPRFGEHDTVAGWGWMSWGVFEHCGPRRAPGGIYKPLGSVTTPNTNTCNQGFGRVHHKPGPASDRYVAAMKAEPPAMFLWSKYYKDMGGDPISEWPELSSFLESHYVAGHRRGPFVALLRRDLADPVAPTPMPWK